MLKEGDVVIKRKRGMPSPCAWGVVLPGGKEPDWEYDKSLTEARRLALKWIARTGGTIHELDQDTGEPFSN